MRSCRVLQWLGLACTIAGMLVTAFPFAFEAARAAALYRVFIPFVSSPPIPLSISEVLFDGTGTEEGDEFVELYNPSSLRVDLGDYKIGDEETRGGSEGMYAFPRGAAIPPNGIVVVARNAAQFRARFGRDPDFEFVTTGTLTDTPAVPDLVKYPAWSNGVFSLANTGDEVVLLGPQDVLVDSAAWASGNFAAVGLRGKASGDAPDSLQRYDTSDTNNMSLDFLHGPPVPGALVASPRTAGPRPAAPMPGGMYAFWGDLQAHSTVSDGSGPPRQAFETARAAGLHFFALTDHDDAMNAEVWDAVGAAARDVSGDEFFVALRGFEYTHLSDGHISIYNTATWVTHDDVRYDSLPELYAWLGSQSGAVAQFNHPNREHGTDFNAFAFYPSARDALVLQEVGNNGDDSGYVRYDAAYAPSLARGWHVAPTNNSDHHGLLWGSDSPHRTGVLMPSLTRANLLDALHSGRVFSTEDADFAIALQVNGVWMGSAVAAQPALNLTVTASDRSPLPLSLALYDNGLSIWSQSFPTSSVAVNVPVAGNPGHYYYVVAVQSDGAAAYTAPVWVH